MQAFSWGPMQGNLQPLQSQHPGLQGETGSARTFGHKLIIYSLLGIRPVEDMAYTSLYPQAVSVQEPAKLCFSQNSETKQNHKSTKLAKVTETLVTAQTGECSPNNYSGNNKQEVANVTFTARESQHQHEAQTQSHSPLLGRSH